MTVPLDQEELHFQAHRLSGVDLSFFLTPGAFLIEACRFAPRDVPLSLAAFPRHVIKRMEQLEVSPARVAEWAALFASPSTTSEGA